MVSVMAGDTFRAYSDPVIFRDDRVLRTLLKKETRYLPKVSNFFAQVQTEVSVPTLLLVISLVNLCS